MTTINSHRKMGYFYLFSLIQFLFYLFICLVLFHSNYNIRSKYYQLFCISAELFSIFLILSVSFNGKKFDFFTVQCLWCFFHFNKSEAIFHWLSLALLPSFFGKMTNQLAETAADLLFWKLLDTYFFTYTHLYNTDNSTLLASIFNLSVKNKSCNMLCKSLTSHANSCVA